MKMRSYIKKREEKEMLGTFVDKFDLQKFERVSYTRKKVFVLLAFFAIVALSVGKLGVKESAQATDDVELALVSAPIAATDVARKTISIPKGTVNANPFLPYRKIEETAINNDVPEFTLTEPPTTIDENSEAVRVMRTTVSGILYDKFSPSAILNIEGSDYLVKKGDVVNNYRVIAIANDSVTVQLGENTYKAGIGELLTEGTLNHNDVSNLNNKFGGAK